MRKFYWQAVNRDGLRQDTIEMAPDATYLRSKLITNAYEKISITPYWQHALFAKRRKLTATFVQQFFYQLHSLLESSISLPTALQLLSNSTNQNSIRQLVNKLFSAIHAGESLHSTLKSYPMIDKLDLALIEIGEESNTLLLQLKSIIQRTERNHSIRQKIKKALTYPIVILLGTLSLMLLLLQVTLPKFSAIYHQLNATLPPLTQWMLNLQQQLSTHGILVLTSTSLSIIFLRFLGKKYRRIYKISHHILIRLPVFRTFHRQQQHTYFYQNLQQLLRAKFSFDQAIQLIKKTHSDPNISPLLRELQFALNNGSELTTAIQQSTLPINHQQLLITGIHANQVPQMLEKIILLSEAEIDHHINRLDTLLEPLLMTGLGLMIAALLLGMYLPILQLGNAF